MTHVSASEKAEALAVDVRELWGRLDLPGDPARGNVASPWRPDAAPSVQVGGAQNIVFDHGSNESLDAIGLVRKVQGCGFVESVEFIIGRPVQCENDSCNGHGKRPAARSATKPPQGQAHAPKPATGQESRKVWKSASEAERLFAALPLVAEHERAREMLRDEYGISFDDLPDTWHVGNHPDPKLGEGVIYRFHSPNGSPVFKYRSLARFDKNKMPTPCGKREARFFYGGGEGALVFETHPDTPWVVAAGEEKALAARIAGFNALCPSTGEKPPSADWISWLIARNPVRIILANDYDVAGAKANDGTARVLEAADFDLTRIAAIAWPPDAPMGHDLSDVAKAGGCTAVRAILESAPTWRDPDPNAPSALCLRDFRAKPREPLRYHIEGIMPTLGKATISAGAKQHKTSLALQIAFCLANGFCRWLDMKFGEPVRTMLIQPEMSDPLLDKRLGDIQATMPAFLDRKRIEENFFIYETEQGRPCLNERGDGRSRVERMFARYKPGVIILDPLYMLFPGLAENDADQMSLALNYLAELTVRFKLAILLIHHFGKAGTTRGSSVFEGWGESDLKLSSVDKHPSICRVDGLFRCMSGDGYPRYWQRPTNNNAWFEGMPNDWTPSGRSEPSTKTPEENGAVAFAILRDAAKPLRYTDLKQRIMDKTKLSERTVKRRIADAITCKLIEIQEDFYVISGWGQQGSLTLNGPTPAG